VLASTTSPASLASISSVLDCRGDRGSAINPVLADSRIPNGPISFINASILDGFADLTCHSRLHVSRAEKKEKKRKGKRNWFFINILTAPRCNCSQRCQTPFHQTDELIE